MEDNLTKAKRALMAPKQLCPTIAVVQAKENKANPGEQDAEKLAKLKETLIKKSREYSKSFTKYTRESRKGQEWCAKICFHAREYRVDTLSLQFSEQSRTVCRKEFYTWNQELWGSIILLQGNT